MAKRTTSNSENLTNYLDEDVVDEVFDEDAVDAEVVGEKHTEVNLDDI